MVKKRILFLGETYRADAITWINGLKEFGDFEIVTWELKTNNKGLNRIYRLLELIKSILFIKKIAKNYHPDMIIAERTTSYGFLAAISGIKPIAIAQQGSSDLWPLNSPFYFLKKKLQDYAFKKADLIHAWGEIMAEHMMKSGVNMSKVMILPKGINLEYFEFNDNSELNYIDAVVTRSLETEYNHETILKAFSILKQKGIPFKLTIVGDGSNLIKLQNLTKQLNIDKEVKFTGRIKNDEIPFFLKKSNFYISMPITEGVSSSLFEAMACGCFPIVSHIDSNEKWIEQKVNGILVDSINASKLAEELEWSFNRKDYLRKVIILNRKFIEEKANYKINMKKIADNYQYLISTKKVSN
ncbi:glycosyltransferase [Flavobacterium capsici]|uniref:Glycosyltransferase n=1 Tax=Flavobacterium capsici TaxID=3075618 RepID=A0AA96EUU3_9FLAO|nr:MULTISPECIES: glycosyltransferase [unclassified Flavobacterium]WNM18849.1 glycosyltransferase [Flavobacterium sp. PMR2A8]WNM22899.1 glycosyltransferase [Flavobacterium sp. PMTSA4]